MSGVKETVLGILFFGALIGLGILTIALTDFDFFKEKHLLNAYFDEASGLKPGDNVRIMGVIQGRVEEIEFLSEPVRLPESSKDLWVKATLKMDVPLEGFLKTDYEIRIRNANLLGGKVVDIELGLAPEPVPTEIFRAGLPGLAMSDPFEEIGDLISENRASFGNIVTNVESLTDHVNVIASDIRTGEGIIHDLIYDRELGTEVRETLTRAGNTIGELEGIVSDVKEAKGPLGRAIYDEDWSQRITDFLTGATDIVEDVKSGSGIVSQIVYNEEWATKVSSFIENAEQIVQDVRDGKGALGLVFSDEKFRSDLSETIANFREFSDKAGEIAASIAEGRGLLGLLVADEEVSAKVKALLEQAFLALEDAREAAPLSSLGSFLFGTF